MVLLLLVRVVPCKLRKPVRLSKQSSDSGTPPSSYLMALMRRRQKGTGLAGSERYSSKAVSPGFGASSLSQSRLDAPKCRPRFHGLLMFRRAFGKRLQHGTVGRSADALKDLDNPALRRKPGVGPAGFLDQLLDTPLHFQ